MTARRTPGTQLCPNNHPGNPGYLALAGGSQIRCDGSNINPTALGLLNFKFSDGKCARERSFPVRDWSSLRFRTEFFKFTNTANFGNPVDDVEEGAAFGRITSTTTNPRIIQFALRYVF